MENKNIKKNQLGMSLARLCELTISELEWTAETIAQINGDTAILNIAKLVQLNAAIDFFATWTNRRIGSIVVFVIANAFKAR